MKKLKLLLLLFTLGFGILIQCTSQNEKATVENIKTEHKEHEEENEHNEMIQLSAEEQQEFGIELAIAGPGNLERHVDLTGEIDIDPDRLAHIFPRFPGIVKKVNKNIGDPVKKDEILAIVESNESLSPYSITSLIDGTVLDLHLTPGEVISDTDHKITIADLSRVWANLNIYQKDLAFIKPGRKVVISAGPGTKTATGTISYISPVVDERTRTATARVVLPNNDGNWKPGLFISARVIIGKDPVAILVPKTALQTFENQTVVFVKDKQGFHPQVVRIGRSNTKAVEIVDGLEQGQQYVDKGGFTIKAELQKESFGEGHGH
ncbi:MAG: efflux RND transporter periplasmic adaptor subunit [Calditrichaeota bacterium]|nr:efflux RND transporter periplasmic adaptor subunit [Calditrichota bacterium]